mmetsp:Transcript_4998/g.8708  ORF Transcript_4998/g.8708 Transcript_4998/m.8708 type:complete len:109 (-) Transcript_4998:36-362(-)
MAPQATPTTAEEEVKTGIASTANPSSSPTMKKNPFLVTVRRKNDLPQARQRNSGGDLYCQKRSLLDVTQKEDPQMMHVVQHQPSHNRRGGNTERTLSCYYIILLLLHN